MKASCAESQHGGSHAAGTQGSHETDRSELWLAAPQGLVGRAQHQAAPIARGNSSLATASVAPDVQLHRGEEQHLAAGVRPQAARASRSERASAGPAWSTHPLPSCVSGMRPSPRSRGALRRPPMALGAAGPTWLGFRSLARWTLALPGGSRKDAERGTGSGCAHATRRVGCVLRPAMWLAGGAGLERSNGRARSTGLGSAGQRGWPSRALPSRAGELGRPPLARETTSRLVCLGLLSGSLAIPNSDLGRAGGRQSCAPGAFAHAAFEPPVARQRGSWGHAFQDEASSVVGSRFRCFGVGSGGRGCVSARRAGGAACGWGQGLPLRGQRRGRRRHPLGKRVSWHPQRRRRCGGDAGQRGILDCCLCLARRRALVELADTHFGQASLLCQRILDVPCQSARRGAAAAAGREGHRLPGPPRRARCEPARHPS